VKIGILAVLLGVSDRSGKGWQTARHRKGDL
jgi:hypothetical protein